MAAFTLPRIEDVSPRLAYTPRAQPVEEELPPLTAEQQAEVDRRAALDMAQYALAEKPRTALGEIITGFKRGAMVELPRMVGQAFEATGKPGDTLYNLGRGIVQGAQAREPQYVADINEGAHGAFVNTFAQGAEMLAPSLAPLAALPVLGAAGVPAAAAVGAAGVAGGALFGASQYQDTYEKGIKAGLPEEAAKSAALKTGAIEALGETAGTWIGGKFVTGAVPRILGKKYTVDAALQGVRNPKFMQQFASDFAKTTAVEVGTEMGQNYGEAAVEKAAGVDTTDPWKAATSAIGPTMAMSAFLGPLGALGVRRQQNANKRALDTIEAIDSTASDTNAALAQIAPTVEPLVGKEQFSLYRIDRLQDAKWFDDAWQGVGAEEGWSQQQQAELQSQQEALRTNLEGEVVQQAQATEDAIVADALKTPEIPAVAPDTLLGRETPYQHYRTQAEAEAVWAAAAPADTRIDAAATALAQEMPGLSFPEFTAQVKSGRAGPLAEKGRATQQQISAAYLAYLDKQEQAKQDTTRAPTGVGEAGRVAEASARLEAAAKSARGDEKPGQGTAKMLGLPTERRIVPVEAPSRTSKDRTKQRIEMLKAILPGMPKTARESLASVDRQNLPEALREIWHARKGEAGPAYNQQVAALYKQLTGGLEISAVTPQPIQETQDGKAEPVRKEITGSSFQDPLAEVTGQGNAQAGVPVQERQEVAPVPAAPAVPRKADSPLAVARTGAVGAPIAQVRALMGRATASVVVTSTGEEAGRPVGYGESSTRVPEGEISYDTPGFKRIGPRPLPRTQFEVQRVTRQRADRAELAERIAPGVRREVKDWESDHYAFELFHFDTERGFDAPGNRMWVQDVREAMKSAKATSTERVEERANANAALVWLKQNFPEEYAAIPARLEQQDLLLTKNAKLALASNKVRAGLRREYADAMRERLARERRVRPKDVKLTKEDKERVRFLAERDPGLEYAQAELPNYAYSDILAQELKRENLDRVLMKLEQSGPSLWVQQMARVLRRLGLKTKLVMVERVAHDPDGTRVYGRYQHLTDTVRIYLGGENAHTVVHEVVHAGSVGRITFAKAAEKKSESSRTREEAAAVADLDRLREIIDAVGFTARNKERVEEEFVAEVFSNERMQQELHTTAFGGRSLWQRFKDWVAEVFGLRAAEYTTALEAAISASIPFLGESRFGAAAGMDFDHSITSALGLTDDTVSAMSAKYDEFSSKVRSDLPGVWNAVWMRATTTHHVTQMVERIKRLHDLLPWMRLYTRADETGVQVRQQVNSEIEQVLKPLDAYLAKVKNSEAVNMKMQELAGEASRLSIDLSKSFDENKASFNKQLDPALKQRVNELHAMYKQQPVVVQQTLQRAVLVNRKHYMQHFANILKINTLAYAKEQPGLKSTVVHLLDITSAKLNEGVNPNPKFFADVYTANLSRQIDLALKHIRETEKGSESALALDTELIESIYRKAVASPYVHLGRTGEHFLEFTVAPGDAAWRAMQQALKDTGVVLGTPTESRKVFMRFESVGERDLALTTVNQLGATVIAPDTTRAGMLSDTASLKMMNKGLSHTLYRVASNLSDQFAGDEKKEVRDALMAELYAHMGDDSPHQALKQRKESGIPGYDANFRRSFVTRGAGASSLISNSLTMPMYNESFTGMQGVVNDMRQPKGGATPESAKAQAQAQAVLSTFQLRFANKLDRVDSPVIDKFKALGYNWFLGASPSFMLTNLMQPYHLSLPYLGARYGFVRSAKEMARSTKKAFALVRLAATEGWQQGMELGGVRGALENVANLSVHASEALSPGEKDMIAELVKSGQLDLGLARELTSLASGTSHAWHVTMRVLATGSHYSEVINRLTTALAAYNLDIERGRGSAAQEHANATAILAVRDTQFNYSDYNTAPWFGRHGFAGKITPLLTSFQNYAFQVQELIFRMAFDSVKAESAEARWVAKKQLAGVLATTSMIAGTLGLPLASVVARLYDAMAGDGDEPSDVKTSYRAWLAEVFGKDVAEAIARGIPRAALGFDMSSRAGLADVVPGSRFFTDRRALKEKIESGAFDMMGPAIGATQDFLTGMGKMSDGFVMEGLLLMTPLAVRGPLKASKIVDKGYTTASGIPLPMEVTPWAVAVQTLGFTPSVKAEQSDVNFAFRQRDGLLKQRKTVLTNQLYKVFDEGGDPTEAMKEAIAFSQQNPQYAIDVAAGMKMRAKARAVANVAEADIATSPRYLPLLQQYSFANTR